MLLQRCSTEADVPAIASIYAHYVRTSVSTFEVDSPGNSEMHRRRKEVVDHGLPHLVAEESGVVLGYAYAAPYRGRKAYRFAVEDSIYVHPEHIRRGIGQLLLNAVLGDCEQKGYRQMIAVIGGADNFASIRLHEKCGFRQAGVLHGVGFKFGRWIDTVLMQRALGSAVREPHK